MKNKRVGIIGGAGFVGSQLGRRLIMNNYVRVLDIKKCSYKAKYVKCDITNADHVVASTKDLDILFHLGVNPNWYNNINNPEVDFNVSVLGILNILEACIKNQINRLVYTSSLLVYGTNVSSPISEQEYCKPSTPYGIAKLIAERFVDLYSKKHTLSTVILRYFRVYGGREIFYPSPRGVVASFIKKIIEGKKIDIHGNGNQALDFVYIDDVIDATIRAGTLTSSGGVFNVGSGTSTSINILADTIGQVLQKPVHKEYVNHDIFTYEIPDVVADISSAIKVLGYKPQVKLEEGIHRTMKYYNSL